MHVTLLSQYFVPEIGAPQTRLFELAIGLKQRGWHVSVITAMPNYPTGKIYKSHRGRFSCVETVSEIEVKRYWLFASNSKQLFPRVLSMLSFSITSLFSIGFLKKRRPDFLFVESPPLTLGISGRLLSMLTSTKLILNISDIWPLSALELGAISKGYIYSKLEKVEHSLYRTSFLCLGQSQEIVDHIKRFKHNHVHLFRNGVDISRFKQVSGNRNRNHFVYLGLLGIAQGLSQLCQAINFRAIDCEFHIYGSGPELNSILTYLKKAPESGIRYCGTVERDEVPKILSNYGGAIIPLVKNIYGAVPSKLYEMMAAGLPILFSGAGEGAAIVAQYKCGWVNEPGDFEQLRSNISSLITIDDATFSEISVHNQVIAEEYFDRSGMIDNLTKFLINQNKRGTDN
ncbi:MAG: glycosyltransferase family 4 protein [Cyclobacteriaceae bacterium]|nr:glycosyltransferase family 4 protein [Cyclobacteriaceae bacterium]